MFPFLEIIFASTSVINFQQFFLVEIDLNGSLCVPS